MCTWSNSHMTRIVTDLNTLFWQLHLPITDIKQVYLCTSSNSIHTCSYRQPFLFICDLFSVRLQHSGQLTTLLFTARNARCGVNAALERSWQRGGVVDHCGAKSTQSARISVTFRRVSNDVEMSVECDLETLSSSYFTSAPKIGQRGKTLSKRTATFRDI